MGKNISKFLVQAFFIKLLNKFVIVQLWTFLTVFFVTNFSIEYYPVFIFASSLTIIVGMLLFSTGFKKIPTKQLILLLALVSCLFMFLMFFGDFDKFAELVMLLILNSILLYQLVILSSALIEERIKKINGSKFVIWLEVSELFALGASSVFLYLMPAIGLKNFFIAMMVSLFLTAVVLQFAIDDKTYKHGLTKDYRDIKNDFKMVFKKKFMASLIGLSFLFAVFGYFTETFYTLSAMRSAGEHSVHGVNLGLLQIFGEFQGYLAMSLLIYLVFLHKKVVTISGSLIGFVFQVVFYILASVTAMFLLPGFLSKNLFEIGAVFHRTSYEYSFFALDHEIRKFFRELNEALILPIGGIAASLIFGIFEGFIVKEMRVVAALMMVSAVAILLVYLKNQKHYKQAEKVLNTVD